jgi:N-methylhydantoinase B/oxoprolinase/acetone carboxylase alpha subunit
MGMNMQVQAKVESHSSARQLDPVTIEVVRNKLNGIAEEMQLTLLRSAFSPIVKEAMDCSAGLFTADGSTLAQATAIPIHLATMIPALEEVIRTFPPETMQAGDAYTLNDPYCGGTHLPDFAVFIPVFANGSVVAFSATITHHQDVGGMSPGSIPTHATEVFQEGIRIPPLKLADRGVPNDTLWKILRKNVRIASMFEGDLNGQLAACTVGARRMQELLEAYGTELALVIFDELLERSENMTRDALRQLPEGTFHYTEYLDNDGVDLDTRVKIQVAVTVKDGTIHFDYTGTSPQVKGPINIVPSGARAAAYYAVRALTDPSIPTNGGCFRPVSVHLPEGSLVNPKEPAAVNARTLAIKRLCLANVCAFAEAIPDKVPAAGANVSLMLSFGGRRHDGTPFVFGELISSGTGASEHYDGVDNIQTDGSNSMNMPVEALMMEAPIRVHRYALRCDSGGSGRFRGGLGVVREYEMLADDVSFTYRGERHFNAARGSQGGCAGATSHAVIYRADGTEEVIPSRTVTTLNRGDRVTFETAGGGGFGNPKERHRDHVRADIQHGKVSREAARHIYGFDRQDLS